MISNATDTNYTLFSFDEFRTNLQDAMTRIDSTIKTFKAKDEAGESVAKIYLYLYQGIFAIIGAEKKYRTGDYNSAANEYSEGGKMITRFQRMSTGFTIEFQQEAERLDLFAKGRLFECQALKKGTKLDDQIANLIEAINSYTLEVEIVEKIKKLLPIYNAKARTNFAQGLVSRLEGQKAVTEKDIRLAKRKHLDAYRLFVTATYYNPSYSIWVSEQNNTIKTTLNFLVKEKASKIWGLAYRLSIEGKFTESGEKCKFASKLYARASKLSSDSKDSTLLMAYSHMLIASMYESNANELLKNKNDAKGATRKFELAFNAMKKAIEMYPKRDVDELIAVRWSAQMQYYHGHFYQSQGIFNLDNEKYTEALDFFNLANDAFQKGLKEAEKTKETSLLKLLQKSVAEAKGYVGMCRTVLD
ncbi:MAG: hypothetical protein HZR80_12320 [Candidatus Heimdallarchaeota archaeon]